MIAKDGYKIIAYTGIILAAAIICSILLDSTILWVLSAVIAVVFVFHFFFFRNPDREAPVGDNLVLAPADGKIIKIDEIDEPLFFQEKVRRVSIFMSVFNVHVNRMPVTGKVEFLKYQKGQFLAAYADKACEHNEQMNIGISSGNGKIMFKQIAGLIARRIVCNAKQDEQVTAGDRFGMIKYSSRVDVFLPLTVQINVNLNDKVTAGISVIGEYTQ